jgi:hypothetical protein
MTCLADHSAWPREIDTRLGVVSLPKQVTLEVVAETEAQEVPRRSARGGLS